MARPSNKTITAPLFSILFISHFASFELKSGRSMFRTVMVNILGVPVFRKVEAIVPVAG